MEERRIRVVSDKHWSASAAGDQNIEHEICADDAVTDYPQAGEPIVGGSNLQGLRNHHPGKPTGFEIGRTIGSGDPWVTEYTIKNGKVIHEKQYFADLSDAPAWQAQWVEHLRK